MAKIKLLSNDKIEEWDRFVFDNALGTIYHTSQWRQLINNAYGHTPIYLVVEDNNGSIRAGLPLFKIESKFTQYKFSSLPCAQSCNPLLSDISEFSLFEDFIWTYLADKKNIFLELKTDEKFPVLDPASANITSDYSTYLLNLCRPLDTILRSFHQSCIQRAIKKAYKSDLKIRYAETLRDVKQFYYLYLKMRINYGLLPQPFRFFSQMWKIMSKRDYIEILFAEYHGRPVSSILLLKYKDTVTYEYGATEPDRFYLKPSQLLLWEAIKKAKNRNFKTFDFGRTSNSNSGLIEFKMRWGTSPRKFIYYYIPKASGVSLLRRKSIVNKAMYYSIKSAPRLVCQLAGRIFYRYLV